MCHILSTGQHKTSVSRDLLKIYIYGLCKMFWVANSG